MNKNLWHISKETFYRFLIPDIFEGYDKIIYLDADVILQTDIAQLLNENLENAPVAACPAVLTATFKKYITKKLHLDWQHYVNSGVLVFNITIWQHLHTTQQIWNLVCKNKKYKTPDQDVLNIVCTNNIKLLSKVWNHRIIPVFVNKCLFDSTEQQEQKLLSDKKILHYVSQYKPWLYPEDKFSQIWWSYARKSPFYEAILFQSQIN